MKTKLALVACTESAEGPWLRARGNETGVRIHDLEEGSHIICHTEIAGVIQPPVILDAAGVWPIPDSWERIRFSKLCSCASLTTRVDLLVA